jgi:hypothetical protein
MSNSSFTVRQRVIIVRQYKNIGITAKLQGYFIPTAAPLFPRFYNGCIAFQYKSVRVGLTTLRKQRPCSILLAIEEPALPF